MDTCPRSHRLPPSPASPARTRPGAPRQRLGSWAMTIADEQGRPEPPVAAYKTETLLGFLDYQRALWNGNVAAGRGRAGGCHRRLLDDARRDPQTHGVRRGLVVLAVPARTGRSRIADRVI